MTVNNRRSLAHVPDFDEGEIDTILAEDIDFDGELTFSKPLMIKGKFTGEIKASGDLYVGTRAAVSARIEADCIVSRGRIKGDIIAGRRVELAASATVEGDISTPDLVVESGCRLNGLCTMRETQSGHEGS